MKIFNPILSFVEMVDDVIAGGSAHHHCQWRGPVVPLSRLSQSNYITDLLEDSHIIREGEEGSAKKNSCPEPYSLEMEDGTFVSFTLVRGTRSNVKERDIADISTNLTRKLAAYMNAGTGTMHSFGIYFLHDPNTADQIFTQKVSPLVATAKRFGGDAQRFVNDLKTKMINRAAEEMILLTVRTHPSAMRRDEVIAATKQYRDLLKLLMEKGKSIPNFPLAINTPFGQALITKTPQILQKHEGLVNTILSDFNHKSIGISVVLLSLREAAERVRRFYDREIPYMPDWKPHLTGTEGALLSITTNRGAPTPVALGMQLVTKKVIGEISNHELSRVGNTTYATAVMEEGPISPREHPSQTIFGSLMQKIREASIPISISYEILPKGLNYRVTNQKLNAMLGSISVNNRQIRAAYKELREYDESKGSTDPIVGWRVSFSTWGANKQKAIKALEDMTFACQGWGSMNVISELGCPDTARLVAVPEYSNSKLVEPVPAPLTDVMYMSPLMRLSSQWDEGQLQFKTSDGVIYSVDFGSKRFPSYSMGICAPSGGGKSFLMNRYSTSMTLAPGAQQLPYCVNIDVAPSGVGTHRMLRLILPKSMHSQICYFKVINSPEYCVNPHDLQLGCERLTGAGLDFLTSVYEVIFDGLTDELSDFISALIEEAYRYFAPDSVNARLWDRTNDQRVEKALREIGFQCEEGITTAYQVTDALFFSGRFEEAKIAQRFAVPRLEDMTRIVNSEPIKRLYGNAKARSSEPLLEKATRIILNAVRKYHILASVTRIELDNARIINIDLQSVLGSTSQSAIEFAGLMYLYARHLGAQNFFLHVDDIRVVCRPEYFEYQKKRVREIQQTPKILTYDEWHNVKSLKGLVGLNVKETRESRKFRVYPTYITQYFSDYPPEMVAALTTVFVVGKGSATENSELVKKLNLSDTDADILDNGLDTIGRFFAYFNLRDGPVTALLQNEVGPLEAWCYTTDDTDAPLRAQLEELIGESEAIMFLAREFPTGSASAYLSKRSRAMSNQRQGGGTETITSIVAKELAEKYFLQMNTMESTL